MNVSDHWTRASREGKKEAIYTYLQLHSIIGMDMKTSTSAHRWSIYLSVLLCNTGKRRYNIKLWKTFTDCFNCLPVAAIVDGKIFCMHGGLSPELHHMDQIRRIARPCDVPGKERGSCLLSLLWHGSHLTFIHVHSILLDLTKQTRVCYAIFYGLTLTRKSLVGVKMNEASLLHLDKILYNLSWNDMT